MTQEQALNVLVQAINLAQSKGSYTLEESGLILEAVKSFQNPNKEATESINRAAKELKPVKED